MPQTDWGWQVTPHELKTWIVHESDELLVVDKPAHLVCHPSKRGPWSSLVGACREYLGLERLHMVSRLDRETSGVVVFAKNQTAGRVLQKAMQERRAAKTYLAIVEGVLGQPRIVEEPIGPDPASEFVSRRWVHVQGQFAATEFNPVAHRDSYTLVEIHPITGRRHQIRVHAAFIGYPIVGDKLYGPDAGLMLRFVAEGFTSELRERLRLDRQALHANKIEFPTVLPGQTFTAPFPKDLEVFWQSCKD